MGAFRYDCKWDDQTITCLQSVRIESPYSVDSCTGKVESEVKRMRLVVGSRVPAIVVCALVAVVGVCAFVVMLVVLVSRVYDSCKVFSQSCNARMKSDNNHKVPRSRDS